MRVEYNETIENTRTARKNKNKKIGPHFFIFLLMIIISVLISLSLTIWFNVTNFKVTGNSVYAENDIISVTGINIGDNIWRMPIDTAEQNIEQLLPYVGDAEVKRKLPGTVVVKITPATEYAYIKTTLGGVVVDDEFKALKSIADNDNMLLNIKGAEVSETVVGQKLQFTNVKQQEVLKELSTALNEYGFSEKGDYKLTMIDVTDELDLSFIVNDKLYVVLGSLNNVENKLTHLKTSLSEINPEASAKIDVSNWSKDNKKASLIYEDISKYK